jgi:hypothetical protein
MSDFDRSLAGRNRRVPIRPLGVLNPDHLSWLKPMTFAGRSEDVPHGHVYGRVLVRVIIGAADESAAVIQLYQHDGRNAFNAVGHSERNAIFHM